jgi:hypothetical protein
MIGGQVGQELGRGEESSHAEAEKEKANHREYQQNDKCGTYSGAKGKSQFPHPLCFVGHLLECDNTA